MIALPTIEQNACFLMFHYLLWKHTNDPINLQLNTRNEIIDKWIFYCYCVYKQPKIFNHIIDKDVDLIFYICGNQIKK
jgi:hypothetical protein